MPGPLASNRLKKAPYMGRNKRTSKAMKRTRRMLDARRAAMPKVSGFRLPGSQNPRKRPTGRGKAS